MILSFEMMKFPFVYFAAKRQRTIQVMELQDLPRQGMGRRNPQAKPGNPNRPRAQVR